MKQNHSNNQSFHIGAVTCCSPLGASNIPQDFLHDAQKVINCINRHWEPNHPERHALVMLFDEQGHTMLADSLTTDQPNDAPTPSVEAHRMMIATLLALTDPRLTNDIWYHLSCLCSDLPLDECTENHDTLKLLPDWVSKIHKNACDMFNGRIELVKRDPSQSRTSD